MISVTKTRNNYEIIQTIRPPTIYLDHWAMRSFSADADLCIRLLDCFRARGTLLFSWLNATEISGNTGESAEQIRRLLAEIGEHWFPMECNPIKVIDREKHYGPGQNNPCFGASFLEAYYPHIHDGPLSLSTAVDLAQDEEIKATIGRTKAALCKEGRLLFETLRDQGGDRTFSCQSSFEPNRPTEFIYNGLMRVIQKEKFEIEDNDVMDFFHAVVALACADFVLLDGRWAELARKVHLPPNQVRVYPPKKILDFLQDLETS